jgi:hypothetical protein
VAIPGPDDDYFVRRRSSTFIPQKLPKNGKDRRALSLKIFFSFVCSVWLLIYLNLTSGLAFSHLARTV